MIDPSAQTERQSNDVKQFLEVMARGLEKGYLSQDDFNAFSVSAYSMSSFIAVNVFMEGINRLADKEITREAFLRPWNPSAWTCRSPAALTTQRPAHRPGRHGLCQIRQGMATLIPPWPL